MPTIPKPANAAPTCETGVTPPSCSKLSCGQPCRQKGTVNASSRYEERPMATSNPPDYRSGPGDASLYIGDCPMPRGAPGQERSGLQVRRGRAARGPHSLLG